MSRRHDVRGNKQGPPFSFTLLGISLNLPNQNENVPNNDSIYAKTDTSKVCKSAPFRYHMK